MYVLALTFVQQQYYTTTDSSVIKCFKLKTAITDPEPPLALIPETESSSSRS